MTALVYLHGFRSSPASIKAKRLRAYVDALPSRRTLHVPQLHHRPAVAMQNVVEWVERYARDGVAFVGSSLGGFYATVAAERHGLRAVLVNPALRPDEGLRAYAGVQTNLYTGESFEVTTDHFAELQEMRVDRISRPERYFLMVQSGDDVLDYRRAVAFYQGAWQFVQGGGDHAFAGFEAQIPAILRFAGLE